MRHHQMIMMWTPSYFFCRRRPAGVPIVTLLEASFLLLLIALMLPVLSDALQLSMMASSSSSDSGSGRRSLLKPPNFMPPPPPGAEEITSTLISQLAVLAVKRRLKEEKGVKCDVSFSSSDFVLAGRVGPVTVRGKGWSSGRGLSCRALEATVQQCELDASKLLSHRKLLLTVPALGKMMVAMNGQDFGNFVTHPLMPPLARDGKAIDFVREGASVDPATGTVQFLVDHDDTRWACFLKRSVDPKMAVIDVRHEQDENADVSTELSHLLGGFFNEMVWDLSGTYLTYRDFMVTDKGEAPSVMFSLNIKVERLPSPGGLDF